MVKTWKQLGKSLTILVFIWSMETEKLETEYGQENSKFSQSKTDKSE
jgi:hypothetical protein